MKQYDVLNFGMAMIDVPIKIPYKTLDFQTDITRLDSFNMNPGGDAANSSIVLSQLGVSVALIAAMGDDVLGNMFTQLVASRGLDISHIVVKKGVSTSVSFAMINPDGDRCFLCELNSNESLSEADFDVSLLGSGAKHLNYGSFFFHPLLDKGGLKNIFQTAKEKGLTISADAKSDIYKTGFETIRPLLGYLDIFMPSYIEAKYMSGETDPKRMAEFFVNKTGDKIIIVKLGSEGSYLYNNGKGKTIPAFKAAAVDTTGAGDNFVGGFLFAYLKGMDTADCVRFGSAVSALSVQYIGATNANVTLENTEAFLKSHGITL